jgi:hypothetical protein
LIISSPKLGRLLDEPPFFVKLPCLFHKYFIRRGNS